MFDAASVNALFLAVIAGLAMLLGACAVTVTRKKNEKALAMALGFAAGVMISASFTDILPEATEFFEEAVGHHGSGVWSIVFLAVGLLLALFMDRLVPHDCGCECHSASDQDISRLGMFSMIAMCLHNLPEGIALFFAGYTDLTLGITLAVAIALHNIPGGITVAMPIYYASGSRAKALLYTLIPALVQPIGALLACLILRQIMTPFVIGAMFAIVAGFLLFIALVELLPSSQHYKYHITTTLALFVGILLMPLSHMFGH